MLVYQRFFRECRDSGAFSPGVYRRLPGREEVSEMGLARNGKGDGPGRPKAKVVATILVVGMSVAHDFAGLVTQVLSWFF